MEKYWYMTFIEECPVCGRSTITRERVYGKKPSRQEYRTNYKHVYDHCED